MSTDIVSKPIKHSGADWMQDKIVFANASKLAVKVADVLGQVYLGIYHIDDAVLLKKVDWKNENEISVTVSGELATFDGCELTLLIFCCVKARVSVQLSGAFKGYTKLTFREDGQRVDLTQQSADLKVEWFPATAEEVAAYYTKKPPLWVYRSPYNAAFSVPKAFYMSELVELVLLAHMTTTRISVQGRTFGAMQMQFCQRTNRKGHFWQKHTDLEMAKARLSAYVEALTL